MPRPNHIVLLLILVVVVCTSAAHSDEWRTLLNLKGTWKIELGDNPRWAETGFDDSRWDDINVPGPWEDEGFPGYDGFAWYRKHFTVDQSLRSAIVYLHVGYVDDVSEVYLNGHMVGFAGKFPPAVHEADLVYEKFPVPQEYLSYNGDNVVAVRVFDVRISGGITRGRVGLYEPRDYLKPDYNLAGTWKFTAGDDPSWKDATTNDSKWNDAVVPAYWETVPGLRDYDGSGWYRLKFSVPENLTGQRLILLLGKIDDVDETYLNGELIGKTGLIREKMERSDFSQEWLQLRAY
ncbi:MAG: sugar-binding domain-containing protein, partial [Bacteroidota bacterium]